MMRFYEPQSGEILLDGVPIEQYNLHELRKAISLVMQEPIIFNYTIQDNMLYGKLEASNTEISASSNKANCTEFIQHTEERKIKDMEAKDVVKAMQANKENLLKEMTEKEFQTDLKEVQALADTLEKKGKFEYLEGDVDRRSDPALLAPELHDGYKTVCGIKGSKLSGGQKQRVAIARTIIREPKVLMLDEATSALDEDSQKKVQQALEAASKGRTTIIIAHRMTTIERCDKIFVLESGKLAEDGGFEELKAKGGLFAKMNANASANQNQQ